MSFFQPYCNGCKNRFSKSTRWLFSMACGHILCFNCAGTNKKKCNLCGKDSTIYPNSHIMVDPALREYFNSPLEILKKAGKVYNYQAAQMKNYFIHLDEENKRLKRLLSASRKQTKFWKGIVPQEKMFEIQRKIKREIKQERVDEGFIDLASSIRSGRSQESYERAALEGINWNERMDENIDSSEISYNSQAQRRSYERLPITAGSSDPNITRNEWRSRVYGDSTARVLSTQPAFPSTQQAGRSWYSSMNRF